MGLAGIYVVAFRSMERILVCRNFCNKCVLCEYILIGNLQDLLITDIVSTCLTDHLPINNLLVNSRMRDVPPGTHWC